MMKSKLSVGVASILLASLVGCASGSSQSAVSKPAVTPATQTTQTTPAVSADTKSAATADSSKPAPELKVGQTVTLFKGSVVCFNPHHLVFFFTNLQQGKRTEAETVLMSKDHRDMKKASCLLAPDTISFKLMDMVKGQKYDGNTRHTLIELKDLRPTATKMPPIFTIGTSVATAKD